MSNNSINWMGNKVLDPSSPRQQSSQSMPQQTRPNPAPAPAYIPPSIQPGAYAPPAPVSMPSVDSMDMGSSQGPPPATEEGFIPHYLASNIGRAVRAEFIVGTNQYMDKTGIISEVGINYFVLYDTTARADVMCDLYSVKFVTIPRG